MLITNFKTHITTPIKGCIHIGAHHGEEKQIYIENNINNVIWIEANPEYENIIKEKTNNEDLVIIRGVGNTKRTVNFNISNNGQSSSILDLELHKVMHPDVFYVKSIEINEDRMVNIIEEFGINIDEYNFLNLDIQGYELEAIKGFDTLIQKFDYIYTEVNSGPLYSNCALMPDIDDYLSNYGFIRIETSMTPYSWGDAIYVKK